MGLDTSGHDVAWREVERFAAAFDPGAWAAAGNPPLDGAALLERTRAQLAEGGFPTGPLPELRAALAAWLAAGARTADAAPVDALLDAIHLRLTEMQRRRWTAPPPLEPALGPRGDGDGSRVRFVAADASASREELYASLAGLLQRAGGVTALHLAAAHYPRTPGPPRRVDAFTFWPPDDRLARQAVASLADLAREHHPPLPADPTAADLRALCPPRSLAAAGYAREGHDAPAAADEDLHLVLDGPALVVSSPSGMHLRGIVLHLALSADGIHVATVTRSFSGTGAPVGVLGVGAPHASLTAAVAARAAAVAGWEQSAEHHAPGLQPGLTAAERDMSPRRAAVALHERPAPAAAWWHRVEHVVRGAYGPAAAAPITWGADPVPLRR